MAGLKKRWASECAGRDAPTASQRAASPTWRELAGLRPIHSLRVFIPLASRNPEPRWFESLGDCSLPVGGRRRLGS
jgi:hypothetical protein